MVQVLRMKPGDRVNLTDGKGNLSTVEITNAHKKHCEVVIREKKPVPARPKKISIAISLLKNTNRFEWFLEKATEIGVSEIIPLICERTEKEKFRYDRMQGICISAMLQSQQCWLPVLHEPVPFAKLPIDRFENYEKYIAHCLAESKKDLADQPIGNSASQIILIGPEGDFTQSEVAYALKNNFIPVSLGETRLRSETAGVVAAVQLFLTRN